jgi:hypothetical protein
MKDRKSAIYMVSSPQLKHVNFENNFYTCSLLFSVNVSHCHNQPQVMKQSDVFIYTMSELL